MARGNKLLSIRFFLSNYHWLELETNNPFEETAVAIVKRNGS